jgi:hypothetical protein
LHKDLGASQVDGTLLDKETGQLLARLSLDGFRERGIENAAAFIDEFHSGGVVAADIDKGDHGVRAGGLEQGDRAVDIVCGSQRGSGLEGHDGVVGLAGGGEAPNHILEDRNGAGIVLSEVFRAKKGDLQA